MIKKRVGLKVKNEYLVKKIAQLISDGELDYTEIITQIHDDYFNQTTKSINETERLVDKLRRVRQSDDILKDEMEKDIRKNLKELRRQMKRIQKLQEKTPKMIDQILAKKYKINPHESDDDF